MATSNLIKKSLGLVNLESGSGTPDHTDTNGSMYVDVSTGISYIYRSSSWVPTRDTYTVSFLQMAATNPADGGTFFQSIMAGSTTTDSTSGFGFQIPYDSYLIAASLNNNFVAGTTGLFITGSCRDSTTGTDIVTLFTDIDLSLAGNNSGNHIYGLNVFITAGTRVSVVYRNPTWAANPTSWRPGMVLTFSKA